MGTHAYSILGVEERSVTMGENNTRVHKFIKVRNPWGSGAVQYRVESGKLISSRNETTKQGFFLVELHDFVKRFSSIYKVKAPAI